MVIVSARFARYVIHSGTITRAMYQQLRTIKASAKHERDISTAYVTNCVHICIAMYYIRQQQLLSLLHSVTMY